MGAGKGDKVEGIITSLPASYGPMATCYRNGGLPPWVVAPSRLRMTTRSEHVRRWWYSQGQQRGSNSQSPGTSTSSATPVCPKSSSRSYPPVSMMKLRPRSAVRPFSAPCSLSISSSCSLQYSMAPLVDLLRRPLRSLDGFCPQSRSRRQHLDLRVHRETMLGTRHKQ